MARSGRNLNAREKKLISTLTKDKVDPVMYVVISELRSDKESRTLHLRHKESGDEFEVKIPR